MKIAEHINNHARKTISSEKHIMLLVDGHSSRDSMEWIETCERLNIIVARLPANTTHILQPCDQLANRALQCTFRKTRDDLLSTSHLYWANTSYNIKLAVAGHQAITSDDARASFVKCGMWPMDYRFFRLSKFSEPQNDSLCKDKLELRAPAALGQVGNYHVAVQNSSPNCWETAGVSGTGTGCFSSKF